jgi:ArsR family transcriptional regulator
VDLAATSALLRLLSDPTRVRLLALLEREELTVAELSAVLRLAQPRVSTHLAKLKEADLVRDRRAGVSSYYRYNGELDAKEGALLRALKESVDDALLRDDERRLPAALAKRARAEGWADTVAGDMERHYSPGRTWETLARGMTQLVETGDVLDIASGDGVLAELLAPRARSIVCVDASTRVVDAARQRAGIGSPFGRGMDREPQARHRRDERALRTRGRTGQVAVHRDDHDAHGRRGISGCGALWHRRASRW